MLKIDIPDSMEIASIWVVWACLAIGALGWSLFVVLEHFGVEDKASWVQAVGSVLAILAAIWISYVQHERDKTRQTHQEVDGNYMRTRRLRVFIGHVRAYIAHCQDMDLSNRPAERPYHDQQMASFQALFGQLLLDEDNLTRLGILNELSHYLYTVQGSYIPGRYWRTDVDDSLAVLVQRLNTMGH